MLTNKVKNYPNPNCNSGDRLYLYVFMEMLKEFNVLKRWEMEVVASQLSNLHYDLKIKTTESINN